MRLQQLLDPGVRVEGTGWESTEIKALTADSRAVEPGSLFAALAGSRSDGRTFIPQAIERGAAAILADPSLAGQDFGRPLILDAVPRRRLALLAARWYGRQPAAVVAVTGTSGKTSVAHLTRQIWASLGLAAGALGTLGLQAPRVALPGGLTTPDSIRLQALLAELATAGIDHLALEASSHGLDQHRLDGVRLKAAAFTNLSRDHFDYHHTEAAYFAAKARLFETLLPAGGTAVLNADVPEFGPLSKICRTRGIDVLDYGSEAEKLRLLGQEQRPDGQRLILAVDGVEHMIETALVGGFQAANLLAAIGLVLASGALPPAEVIAAAKEVRGVPGRLELIGRHASGAPVFVDYAHKPDALEKVLTTLRPHVSGQLSVVFGCGGDRDPGKRAPMGEIACRHADRVFITDDNPRSEEPETIRRAILDACPGGIDVADRGDAIRRALDELRDGDLLVVAGKGHETGQIVGDRVLPFDDAAVIRAALADRQAAPLLDGSSQ
jgi:UDP-N-acetylmuramoyl-L-alanyl-D-glutamate--2,6-diaminopimelate ligase